MTPAIRLYSLVCLFALFVCANGAEAQSNGSPLGFVPVQPCRLVDTRNSPGPLGGPSMPAESSRSFPLAGNCGIPSSVSAYSLNITVVPHATLGYLSIWPTGEPQPYVSTLNSYDGRIKANAAIVPAGAGAAVSVFVTDDADLILDVNGYFEPFSNPLALSFYPVTPCRVMDTRNPVGPLGGPTFAAAESRTVPVQISTCNIPPAAAVYSLNITVVPANTLGYLNVWPTGSAQPYVSTLNDTVGTVIANAAIVPAGNNAAVDIAVTDTTDVIVDINGYFAPPQQGTGLAFFTVPPCRVSDTRSANGTFGGPSLGDRDFRGIPVPLSACSIPATASAYSLNVTTLPDDGLGFLALWPTNQSQPYVSTLNSFDGAVVSNAAIVPASGSGSISVYASDAAEVVLDINGYFADPNAALTPFTPIYVSDANIDTSQPFTAQFSNAQGYSFSEQPGVDNNGRIVVGAPIYMDPGTNNIDSGTVQMKLQQGSYNSSPQTINIQSLAIPSDYGLQRGDATNALLVFDAMLLARRINQLQTFQQLQGNTIDTTQALATLQQSLIAVIEARHDVDKVIQNNGATVQDETLPNGYVVTFDTNALDMMDRLNCNFLLQTFANVPVPSGVASHEYGARDSGNGSTLLAGIVKAMQTLNGTKDYTEGMAQYQEAPSWIQRLSAFGYVAGGVQDIHLGTGAFDDTTETQTFGLVASLLQQAQTIGDAFAQDAAYIKGVVTGDEALQQVALQAMIDTKQEHKDAAIGLMLDFLGGPTYAEALGDVSTIGKFLKNAYELNKSGADQQADETQIDVANEVPSLPASDAQDFGFVDGNVQVVNSDGIASAQTGIDVQPSGYDFQTLADTNGDYEVLLPLQALSLDYSGVNLEAYDPVSDNTLSYETLDLTGLTGGNTITAPNLTGTCSDTDDDEDDPDCD